MSLYRRLVVAAAVVMAPAVFAAAPKPDIENGMTTFTQQCGICHGVTREQGPLLGPNLLGVVGRKPGADKNFPSYSTSLKDYKVTWNAKTLDEFLANPMSKVPGTTMPMMIPDAKTRADVVAYLATLK